MNYAEIKLNDIANGPGVRISLFVSGCSKRCPDCFNTETWDFDYGKPFHLETMDYILDQADKNYIDGLSILGGEPLHPRNVFIVSTIIASFKKAYPNKSIWVWTGYIYEDLIKRIPYNDALKDIFGKIDVLVDGPFKKDEKDLLLRFRGSTNQRIIDINKSKKIVDFEYEKDPVLWKDDDIFEKHSWL